MKLKMQINVIFWSLSRAVMIQLLSRLEMLNSLKGLFHPACHARVVSWFAFVVAIFMGHVVKTGP